MNGRAPDRPATLERLRSLNVEPWGRLSLRRAWPRGSERLSLEYVDAAGSTVAGQWFLDAERARQVTASTSGALDASPGVVLQPGGADRRLPALRRLAAESGAVLVVHRPERRAVVRRSCGWFTKVVRPDRLDEVLENDRRARSVGSVDLAPLAGVDRPLGAVSWEAARGRSLHDLLIDPAVGLDELERAGRSIGTATRALHDAPPPADLVEHRPAHEVEAAARWLRSARVMTTVPGGACDRLDRARRSLASGATPPCVVHRDLHDKQMLVAGDEVVMLDVDTLALGEPAVDLANLLVHLELRVYQGVARSRADAVAAAFVNAYRPTPEVRSRVAAYADATRSRLAGVYAFRPDEHVAARAIASSVVSSADLAGIGLT